MKLNIVVCTWAIILICMLIMLGNMIYAIATSVYMAWSNGIGFVLITIIILLLLKQDFESNDKDFKSL